VHIFLIILSQYKNYYNFTLIKSEEKINFLPIPLIKVKASTMASTNVRFTLCDIDLNVEITLLPNLNIDAEISLTNQTIFGLEVSAEESKNGTGTKFCLNLKIRNKLCLKTKKKQNFSFPNR